MTGNKLRTLYLVRQQARIGLGGDDQRAGRFKTLDERAEFCARAVHALEVIEQLCDRWEPFTEPEAP